LLRSLLHSFFYFIEFSKIAAGMFQLAILISSHLDDPKQDDQDAFSWNSLQTVFAEGQSDFRAHAFSDHGSLGKTTTTLGTHANISVTRSTGTMFRLASGRQTNSLLNPFMGFHFS
jgi:hypothetical protein